MLSALLPILVIGQTELPAGSSPPALPVPHFPDRLHAFVWRNWQLVPPERMAATVGASRDDIVRIGHAMGLSGPPRISQRQWQRSYVTIIRRNWHLLPYDQLLTLLGWSAEQMAFTLREDDFLFVKLGNLKPRCEPLRYAPPSAEATQAAKRIASLVRQHFSSNVGLLPKPLFSFVKELSSPHKARPTNISSRVSPRFCYSYFGLYGDPLSDAVNDPYPDGYLARLAESGVDGVWLQAVLYKLHPFPWQPALSDGYERRLRRLRQIVLRAKRHGMRVFLYLNEPRAMPATFFATHPQLKGAPEGDHAALCTSVPEVQDYLRDAVAGVCRAVPELGGFFTITMSENLTNCWSHGGAAACPRCSQRSGADGIAEVNRLFWEGIQKAGGHQDLIVWDWGWPDDWAERAIRGLPQGVAFMSVSEWSLPIERGGVASAVGEYSISAVGPGPRARRHWAIAKARGLRTIAKVQAGATWEMSAVPYVPALRLVAQHAHNLAQAGVDGIMLSWTVGGYPSPNLEVFRDVLSGLGPEEAMREVAVRRYGREAADDVVAAWNEASRGFEEFPFHIGTLYTGPQHAGPSNLLWLKPTGYRATMVGFPYDDLESWRSIYPPEVFIRQLRRVADGFAAAAERLRGNSAPSVILEAGLLRACALHFASSVDQAEFIHLRGRLTNAPAEEATQIRQRMRQLAQAEMQHARELYELQIRDPRIGFEATAHYYYVPLDLVEKVLNCQYTVEALEQR